MAEIKLRLIHKACLAFLIPAKNAKKGERAKRKIDGLSQSTYLPSL